MIENQIICGDNIEVLQTIPLCSVDLVVTSPPYDNLRDYKGYDFNFEGLVLQLKKVLKTGGVIVWVVGDATIKGSETGTSFKQALYFMGQGFNLHDTMIYLKNNFSNPSSNRYHQVFEYTFIFSKGKPKTFNPIKDRKNKYVGQRSWGSNTVRQRDGKLKVRPTKPVAEYGMRYNVWKYNIGGCGQSSKSKIAYKHPAIFPEQLAIDHIKSWSNGQKYICEDCGYEWE